jgi:hypothetical protein
MDDKLCVLSVSQDGLALKHCKEKHERLCKIAITQNSYALQYCPKNGIVYELCDLAVSRNGLALKSCPKDKIDYKLCELAVSHDASALKYCPDIFTDDKQDLILMAINKKHTALNCIKTNHKYYAQLEQEARDIAKKLGVLYHGKDIPKKRFR